MRHQIRYVLIWKLDAAAEKHWILLSKVSHSNACVRVGFIIYKVLFFQ